MPNEKHCAEFSHDSKPLGKVNGHLMLNSLTVLWNYLISALGKKISQPVLQKE